MCIRDRPEALANGICSLNAGVDRLALACRMELDRQGNIKSYSFHNSVIHVDKRCTYEDEMCIRDRPQGQMGNSEVGHMNIGAGRIVYQELTRITKSIEDGDFYENPVLREAIQLSLIHIFCLLVAHFAHVPNGDGELQLSILPLDLQGDLIPDGFAFDGGEEGVVIGYILAIHLKDDVLGLDPGLTGRAADHHPIYHHAGP